MSCFGAHRIRQLRGSLPAVCWPHFQGAAEPRRDQLKRPLIICQSVKLRRRLLFDLEVYTAGKERSSGTASTFGLPRLWGEKRQVCTTCTHFTVWGHCGTLWRSGCVLLFFWDKDFWTEMLLWGRDFLFKNEGERNLSKITVCAIQLLRLLRLQQVLFSFLFKNYTAFPVFYCPCLTSPIWHASN